MMDKFFFGYGFCSRRSRGIRPEIFGYQSVLLISAMRTNIISGNFLPARWAPTSYKWSYSPYKWPYKWVTTSRAL